MVTGGLIFPKKEVAGNISVSWSWYDEANGTVEWTFKNSSSQFISGLLFRASYPFGNAFWPIYVDNPAFDTNFTSVDYPLVDNGVENNSPPLVIYSNPNSSLFAAFLFSLSAGQEWSMLESGFVDGLTPDYDAPPVFVPAVKIGIKNYLVSWDSEQCSAYNSQAQTQFPCPKNPLNITSAVFSLTNNISPLFHDIFISKNSETCADLVINGIETGNSGEIMTGMVCTFGDLTEDVISGIKKL